MTVAEILAVGASAAVAALTGCLVYRYLVEFMLERRGTITRGTVVGAVEMGNGYGGALFIVSYEFASGSTCGNTMIYRGKQLMSYSFRPKDTVVVRYWSKWPRLNLIADRAV
jgi:hypothetical protein